MRRPRRDRIPPKQGLPGYLRPVVDVSGILELLGAGSLGGYISESLLKGGERRKTRVEVRDTVLKISEARWVPEEPVEPSLQDLLRTFETQALLARIPRDLARFYVEMALTSRALSELSIERTSPFAEDDETWVGGGIEVTFNKIFLDTLGLISDYLWNPVTTLPTPRLRGLRKRLDARRKVDEDLAQCYETAAKWQG